VHIEQDTHPQLWTPPWRRNDVCGSSRTWLSLAPTEQWPPRLQGRAYDLPSCLCTSILFLTEMSMRWPLAFTFWPRWWSVDVWQLLEVVSRP
jgi:hypothetical protein